MDMLIFISSSTYCLICKKGHAAPSVSFVLMIPNQCNFIHARSQKTDAKQFAAVPYQFIVRIIEIMMNKAARIFVIFSSAPSIERPLFLPQ